VQFLIEKKPRLKGSSGRPLERKNEVSGGVATQVWPTKASSLPSSGSELHWTKQPFLSLAKGDVQSGETKAAQGQGGCRKAKSKAFENEEPGWLAK